MFDLDEINVNSPEIENQMLEHFGDQFIEDAIRVVRSRTLLPTDAPLIHEAMCLLVSMYARKLNSGEINKNKVYH